MADEASFSTTPTPAEKAMKQHSKTEAEQDKDKPVGPNDGPVNVGSTQPPPSTAPAEQSKSGQ